MKEPRPSPTESATGFPSGHERLGNDGSMYKVVLTKQGVHRWQKSILSSSTRVIPKTTIRKSQAGAKDPKIRRLTVNGPGRVINIVDNGGSPFRVRLSSVNRKGRADVYVVNMLDEENDISEYIMWKSFHYHQAFIGFDPSELNPSHGWFGPTEHWWHGGNSVLLQLTGNTYMFIGNEIYSFVSFDEITGYMSPMGNSAVPYPYAIGKTNTYLLVENTWIPNNLLAARDVSRAADADPYDIYYNSDVQTGLPWTSVRAKNTKMKAWETAHRLKKRKVLHERI